MSKEKLTVDEVLNEIKKHYYQVWIKCNLDTGVNVGSLIKTLLEQIRDDLKNEFDKGLKHSEYVVVDKVFNKYLNENGGK